MVQWITAMSALMTAISAIIAVWRYFFAANLPINLAVLNKFLGDTACDGQTVDQTASYQYRLTNYGNSDIQIGALGLQCRIMPFCWHDIGDVSVALITSQKLPLRIPPTGNEDIMITIGRPVRKMHRLIAQEYGSFRSATYPLSEFEGVL